MGTAARRRQRLLDVATASRPATAQVAACETLTDETACESRMDCIPVYDGTRLHVYAVGLHLRRPDVRNAANLPCMPL